MKPSDRLSEGTRDEIQRLADAAIASTPLRMVASSAGIALCYLFLPAWFVTLCLVADSLCDAISLVALHRLRKAATPGLYRLFFAVTVGAHLAYIAPPVGLILAAAPENLFFASCFFFGALLHIALVLSLHLPLAFTCLAAVSLPMAAGLSVPIVAGEPILAPAVSLV